MPSGGDTWVSQMHLMQSKAIRFGYLSLTMSSLPGTSISRNWNHQTLSPPPPPHTPIFVSNHDLLRSYTWLSPDPTSDETESDDVVPSSLQPYSHQRHLATHSEPPSFNHEWDRMMTAIKEAGEIVIDLDAIAANLRADLEVTMSKGGKHLLDLTSTLNGTSLLKTPHSDAMADVYDDVSMLETPRTESPGPVSHMAFATACSDTPAPTISDHHLDRMVFATTVMTSTALIASGQQIHSADGILLEPLSLNEAKTHDNWYKWQEAMVSEMDSMHKMNIFELVDIPKSGKLIGIRWVYKLKLDAQ
ncbi:uncharacterized protein UHO2_00323 [Ustilago hordei]|uniref:uncharacterized protein n=1 Tax=Ustilago hordei TaxID=120017 RepID=UPI001A49C4AB|nr:uncharacterized protein UHO2_00323 [Ustilago hordei]SYW81818.1 uncharacterized protein UHO2_00323 [Ustilago hordei]